MSLKESIAAYSYQLASSLSNEVLEVLSRNTSMLQEQNLAGKALKVGEKFPSFCLNDSDNNSHSLDALLSHGPIIISFYRGGWCPYCVLELKALRDIIGKLPELNATLIAISPETSKHSTNTKAQNALNFIVLSDNDNMLAKQCNLVFKVPTDLIAQYNHFGMDIKSHNGNEKFELPIPATYIIDQQRMIRFAFVEEDYISRAEPEQLLEVLQSMANGQG
jgi:peroxiredoxin